MAVQRKKSIADIRAQEERILRRIPGGWNTMSERDRARATRVVTTARRYVDNINKAKSSQRDLAEMREAVRQRGRSAGNEADQRRFSRKFSRSTYMGTSNG